MTDVPLKFCSHTTHKPSPSSSDTHVPQLLNGVKVT